MDESEKKVWAEVLAEAKRDPRWHHSLHGCFECGVCVGSCPSARYYDYSPRRIAQAMAREDLNLLKEIVEEDIWNCSQCYACTRCPRGNSPGGLVIILREVAVKHALPSAVEAMTGYTRVIYKVMTTGTQVSSDMLQVDAFPDWGPQVADTSKHLDEWRQAIPTASLWGTKSSAWNVDQKTRLELYRIWQMTGVMDWVKPVAPSVAALLEEEFEEALEEEGEE